MKQIRRPYSAALALPPATLERLGRQLAAIEDVATLDRLEALERSGRKRQSVLRRCAQRRRALSRRGSSISPKIRNRTTPVKQPEAEAGPEKKTLSAASLEASGQLAAALDAPPAPPVLDDGLHPGVPPETYHAIDAASNSRLGWLQRSAAHLKAYIANPPTFVDQNSVGRALHCLLYEPAEFERRYARGPIDHRGKKEWLDFAKELPQGVIGLRPSDWLAVHSMRERILAHPAAALALDGIEASAMELTALWTDPETNVRIKVRPDGVNRQLGTIIDLKSAEDASPAVFSRAVLNYGYHRQGALYQDGMRELEPAVEWRHHAIIAAEKDPPYAVAVYELDDFAVTAGREEIRTLLPRYADCMARDEWPGYATGFVPIGLPRWYWSQLEEVRASA